jgi:hypothetical protein
MNTRNIPSAAIIVASLAVVGGIALAAQDRYSLQVPGGLAFSEFIGYEDWQTIAVSHNGDKVAIILGNPVVIEAYKAGIPGNSKPFPDGARMAKIHWMTKKAEDQPGDPVVPGVLHDTDFMVKDSKRFSDSGSEALRAINRGAIDPAFRKRQIDNHPTEHLSFFRFPAWRHLEAADSSPEGEPA